jgi:hypothetical protein
MPARTTLALLAPKEVSRPKSKNNYKRKAGKSQEKNDIFLRFAGRFGISRQWFSFGFGRAG